MNMYSYPIKNTIVQVNWVKNPETFADFKSATIYSPRFEEAGYWHELYHLYQEQSKGLLTWHMKFQNELIRTGSLVLFTLLVITMLFYSEDFAIRLAGASLILFLILGVLEWGIEIPAILYQKEMEKKYK